MNEKEGLNLLDFLATGINKQDPAIKAILSDENGKGAAANEIEEVIGFIKYYSRTDDVRNHRGKSLEMLVRLFARLQRRINEEDDILLRRFIAIICRNGDTVWGNVLDLKHIFEIYFKDIICYIAENTNQDSILPNGSFDADKFWVLDGGASYNYENRFCGLRCLLFDGGKDQSCTQEIDFLNAGNYTFHFMLWGKCGVIIQREDGKYWNANDQKFSGDTVLEWADDEVINIFYKQDGWEDAYCFLALPENAHNLSIKFVSIENEPAFIDYARLFIKPLNPSYTLILNYIGYSATNKDLHIGKDGDEPIHGLDYKKESYFDEAFIVGPSAIPQNHAFNLLLDKVKPCGIQVFVDYAEKKEKEDS